MHDIAENIIENGISGFLFCVTKRRDLVKRRVEKIAAIHIYVVKKKRISLENIDFLEEPLDAIDRRLVPLKFLDIYDGQMRGERQNVLPALTETQLQGMLRNYQSISLLVLNF